MSECVCVWVCVCYCVCVQSVCASVCVCECVCVCVNVSMCMWVYECMWQCDTNAWGLHGHLKLTPLVSHCLYVCVSLFLFSVCLFLCVWVCVYLFFSVSIYFSLPLSFSLSIFLSLFVFLWLFLPLHFSPSLPPPPPPPLLFAAFYSIPQTLFLSLLTFLTNSLSVYPFSFSPPFTPSLTLSLCGNFIHKHDELQMFPGNIFSVKWIISP